MLINLQCAFHILQTRKVIATTVAVHISLTPFSLSKDLLSSNCDNDIIKVIPQAEDLSLHGLNSNRGKTIQFCK